MWVVMALLSALFAGITAILAKVGMKQVESNLGTALRTIVVLVFAWLMVFIKGSQNTIGSISEHTLLFLVLSGLATGASWLCYFKALQLGDVNKVTPIDKSSTVLSMLLAFIFLHEGLTPLKVVCMVLIGVGTYLMIAKKKSALPEIKEDDKDKGDDKDKDDENDKTGENDKTEAGNENKPVTGKTTRASWLIYAVFSAVFASLTSILGKIGISGIESNLGTAIRTVVVLIMAWIVVFVTGAWKHIQEVKKKNAVYLVLSGITTGMSWLCYYRALQEGPASVVVPIDKLSIWVTVIFSGLFLKEKMYGKSWAGLLLITAGTLLLLI